MFLKTAKKHTRTLRTYGFGSGGYINLSRQTERTLRNAFGFHQNSGRPYHWVHFLYELERWDADAYTSIAFELVRLAKRLRREVVIDFRELSRWARRHCDLGESSDQWDIFRQKCEENDFWGGQAGVFGDRSTRKLDAEPYTWCLARAIVVGEDNMRLRLEATLFFDDMVLDIGERDIYANVEILLIREKPFPYPKYYNHTKKEKFSFFPVHKHALFITFCAGEHTQSLLEHYARERGFIPGIHASLNELSHRTGVESFPREMKHVFGYPEENVHFGRYILNHPVVEMLRGMVNLASSAARSHRRRGDDDMWFGMLKVIFTEYGSLTGPVDVLMVDCFRRIIRAFGLMDWMTEAFAAIPLYGKGSGRGCADSQYLDGLIALSAQVCLMTRFGRGYVSSGFRHQDGEVVITSESQTPMALRRLVEVQPPKVWLRHWECFSSVAVLQIETLDTFSEMGISGKSVLECARVVWPGL
jgi:hypothetical protein